MGGGINIPMLLQTVSDVTGCRQTTLESYNGSLVELNSPQLFANKIIELSNNVILRENFVKNALKDIDKYSLLLY